MTRRRGHKWQRMRDSRLAAVAAWIVLLVLALASSREATDLTGILLYGLDDSGNPVGPFWHTSITPEGRPLGVVNWRPDQVRGVPPAPCRGSRLSRVS
jgi:hypothetical protein